MKNLVTISLWAFIAVIFIQECNGTRSDISRIRLSVFRIFSETETLQTGALTTREHKKILTFDTKKTNKFFTYYGDLKYTKIEKNRIPLFAESACTTKTKINSKQQISHDLLLLGFKRDPVIPENIEPLPLGNQDDGEDQHKAEIVGWTKNDQLSVLPITIPNRNKDVLMNVNIKGEFMKNLEGGTDPYVIRQGDLLIQSNKIIGMLHNFDLVKKRLSFYRLAYSKKRDDITFEDDSDNSEWETCDELSENEISIGSSSRNMD